MLTYINILIKFLRRWTRKKEKMKQKKKPHENSQKNGAALSEIATLITEYISSSNIIFLPLFFFRNHQNYFTFV